ncbi:hypothetical protein [Novosphingobium sp. CECT 9465]|uniref:hypothetical protein n=1 Tax=Novosphingobium sp. CECT 9465 TaxID=2829794 RepID=UPI001E4468AF|nr:hypothetical protein [Novosphingobium sp. CECT 9465]CAH0496612.1 hypothetical protein NVSP9465_01649 [Novosphingobium sp. CECT 9465]
MIAFVMAALLGASEPASASLSTGDMLPVASAKLSDCIVYNAVRADDGTSDVAGLVEGARISCATKLGIWRYVARAYIVAQHGAVDTDKITAGSERSFFDTVNTKVATLIEAGRKN